MFCGTVRAGNNRVRRVSAASMSYGECEADMTASTTSGVGYYNNQWQQFAAEGIVTPERLRIERVMEVLAASNTAAARNLIGRLAAGAAGTWMTDAAQRTQARMPPTAAPKAANPAQP